MSSEAEALGTNFGFCPAPGTCGNGHNDASGCYNSVTSAAGLPGGGKLRLFGSASISADSLFLLGSDLRPNKLATGIYGNSMAPVPFVDGQCCVSAPFFRLPAVTVNGIGDVVMGPCITSTLNGFAAGSTVNFQLFYRDGGAHREGQWQENLGPGADGPLAVRGRERPDSRKRGI